MYGHYFSNLQVTHCLNGTCAKRPVARHGTCKLEAFIRIVRRHDTSFDATIHRCSKPTHLEVQTYYKHQQRPSWRFSDMSLVVVKPVGAKAYEPTRWKGVWVCQQLA